MATILYPFSQVQILLYIGILLNHFFSLITNYKLICLNISSLIANYKVICLKKVLIIFCIFKTRRHCKGVEEVVLGIPSASSKSSSGYCQISLFFKKSYPQDMAQQEAYNKIANFFFSVRKDKRYIYSWKKQTWMHLYN